MLGDKALHVRSESARFCFGPAATQSATKEARAWKTRQGLPANRSKVLCWRRLTRIGRARKLTHSFAFCRTVSRELAAQNGSPVHGVICRLTLLSLAKAPDNEVLKVPVPR